VPNMTKPIIWMPLYNDFWQKLPRI
jgi:hypothetical protein